MKTAPSLLSKSILSKHDNSLGAGKCQSLTHGTHAHYPPAHLPYSSASLLCHSLEKIWARKPFPMAHSACRRILPTVKIPTTVKSGSNIPRLAWGTLLLILVQRRQSDDWHWLPYLASPQALLACTQQLLLWN